MLSIITSLILGREHMKPNIRAMGSVSYEKISAPGTCIHLKGVFCNVLRMQTGPLRDGKNLKREKEAPLSIYSAPFIDSATVFLSLSRPPKKEERWIEHKANDDD